jgi:hypothetical protein
LIAASQFDPENGCFHFADAKLFHDTVRHMNKRALLYAGFLTAAFAVLLTSARLHQVFTLDGHARTVANR